VRRLRHCSQGAHRLELLKVASNREQAMQKKMKSKKKSAARNQGQGKEKDKACEV
jgi:hypothetical protein